ncbi:MAG TPA: histidine phosphatase family protein [Anaerolineae bacterium]|nr:histidine phosphatase family protein [Anaerolineae bacterium]
MAVHTIYLVRHGQYDTRVANQDELEGDLTVVGREQARLTGERLRGLGVQRLYSSDLRRAVSTAAAVATVMGEKSWPQDRLLRECFPYFPLGYESLLLESGYTMTQIVADKAQAEQAFARYFQPVEEESLVDVIVCHGNLIRYFVCRVLGIPITGWLDMGTYNCGVTTVQIKENGDRRLYGFNDVGHLPAELVTHNMVVGPRGI